ncbi:MAG: CYTH domain-containing protein [Candidatus Sericytochromatia bacterium]|nr:CYTH domain-containing protein [Candidatus Sericytochromatia bacterium]
MAEEKETKYRLLSGQDTTISGILGSDSETFRLVDRYYDLKDRVVRLRWRDGAPRLTLKGAARWEGTTKIREEWEQPLPPGQDEVIDRLMHFLGHTIRTEITKQRTTWHQDGVEVAVDRLDGIDAVFLEIEGEGEAITRMAERIGLSDEQVEGRSYLSIWMKKDHPTG